MSDALPSLQALVLYKFHPARVKGFAGDKIEIEFADGKTKRVRAKDFDPLHPGPLRSFGELVPRQGDLIEAWELLQGEPTTLRDLAELVFGEFTPATAWSTWELVNRGLHFAGTPAALTARSAEEVQADQEARDAKARAEQEWQELLARLRERRMLEEDRPRLAEIERIALFQGEHSRILQALEWQEKPQAAHRFLVGLGYWEATHNPYPHRMGINLADPALEFPSLADPDLDPDGARLDLTHLAAYAIDDEGSHDPDDALSLERGLDGERIWVHVADVAAVVAPDSELDREARVRGANLYLPEGITHMLPPGLTEGLALGLHETSPALSIGFRLDAEARVCDVQVHTSTIRAQRLTYDEVNGRLAESPFAELVALADRYRRRREAAGAAFIDLPEASTRVRDGEIQIRPLPRIESRQMVTDCMLMAGEAVAQFAQARNLAIPYAVQPKPDLDLTTLDRTSMAAQYAARRSMKPSQTTTQEGLHAGLGITGYTRATSPLRRYMDLVVHQQLRAVLAGREPLSLEAVGARIAESEMGSVQVRKAERFSNQHWKLVYLSRNPGWRGQAVVVDKVDDKRATVIIPELALETRMRLSQELPLDAEIEIKVREVDVPDLTVWFRVA